MLCLAMARESNLFDTITAKFSLLTYVSCGPIFATIFIETKETKNNTYTRLADAFLSLVMTMSFFLLIFFLFFAFISMFFCSTCFFFAVSTLQSEY